MTWAIVSTGASVLLLLVAIRWWHTQRRRSAALHKKLDQALREADKKVATKVAEQARHRLN